LASNSPSIFLNFSNHAPPALIIFPAFVLSAFRFPLSAFRFPIRDSFRLSTVGYSLLNIILSMLQKAGTDLDRILVARYHRPRVGWKGEIQIARAVQVPLFQGWHGHWKKKFDRFTYFESLPVDTNSEAGFPTPKAN
jgi:hypothetical protein